jgi:hypothetical protein
VEEVLAILGTPHYLTSCGLRGRQGAKTAVRSEAGLFGSISCRFNYRAISTRKVIYFVTKKDDIRITSVQSATLGKMEPWEDRGTWALYGVSSYVRSFSV